MILSNRTYQALLASPDFDGGRGWITYFTPTYNRASFLDRPYGSLTAQTDRHFVWILVVDGSTDGSEQVARELAAREELPVLVCVQPNGGKHKAFRSALEQCRTEFFVCMDDDDRYLPEATACFLQAWRDIRSGGPADLGAVRALTARSDGTVMAEGPVPEGCFDASTLEARYKMGIRQENWTCYSVRALRDTDLFPEGYYLCERHRFFNEAIWQGRFARRWRCRYIPKVLRIYGDDAPESLSRPAPGRQALLDKMINTLMVWDEQYDYISACVPWYRRLRTLLWLSSVRPKLGLAFRPFIHAVRSAALRRCLRGLRFIGQISPRPSVPGE